MEQSRGQSGLKKAVANRSPRSLTIVSLLAVVPVVLFALGRSALAVVAVINVVLIFGSLYLLTSPTESGDGHEDDPGRGEESEVGDRAETVDDSAV